VNVTHRRAGSRAVPPLWPAGRCSLSASWKRRGKEESELEFWGTGRRTGFVAPRVTRCHRSKMDGSRRVGLDSAQVDREKVGPGLCCFNIRAVGLVTRPHSFLGRTRIGLWAGFGLVFLSVFSFSRNNNKPV
jgi:hypothetical protein